MNNNFLGPLDLFAQAFEVAMNAVRERYSNKQSTNIEVIVPAFSTDVCIGEANNRMGAFTFCITAYPQSVVDEQFKEAGMVRISEVSFDKNAEIKPIEDINNGCGCPFCESAREAAKRELPQMRAEAAVRKQDKAAADMLKSFKGKKFNA